MATNNTAATAAVSTTSFSHPGEAPRRLEKRFDTAPEDHIGVDLISYLQNVAFPSNYLVKHRVDKEAQYKTRNQSGNNDDGKRFLSV